jgi:ABC-type phosphate transport system permease subunit
MRRHHEALAAVPSIVTGLSVLIPFAGALWMPITTTQNKDGTRPTR